MSPTPRRRRDAAFPPAALRPIIATLEWAEDVMAWAGILKAGVGALCALAMASAGHATPRRSGPRAVSACAPADRPGLLAESAPGRIVFDGGAERVTLRPTCGGSLAERVRQGEGRRFILLVDDLRARRASGVMFSLRLAEPAGGDETGAESVLGSLNFFAARPPEAPGALRRMSYDVTRTVQALAEVGRLDRGLTVLLRPSEPPAPGAELSVARLQLVEQ